MTDREKKILLRVTEKVDEGQQVYLKRVFETIFETSKAYQTMNAEYRSDIGDKIKEEQDKITSKKIIKLVANLYK